MESDGELRYGPTLREAYETAVAAMAGASLEMTSFGEAVSELIIAGDLTVNQAAAILLEYHRCYRPDAPK